MELLKCDNHQRWNEFVEESPQYNIFCQTSFLNSLKVEYELWWIIESQQPLLGVVILIDSKGMPHRAPFSFSLYHGVLFSGKYSKLQVNQYVKKSFELVDFLLLELEKKYRQMSFCLHHKIQDIRSFSWFNYHSPEKGRFNVDVNYTGIIDLTNVLDFDAYLKNIRKSRRYEYRKAVKDNLSVEITTDIDLLEQLYIKTFERQKMKVDYVVLNRMKNIAESAISNNYGDISVCRNKEGDALSASLFLFDNSSCYYLIGANDPEYRQTGSGVFLVLENIRRYQEQGYKFIDVCGLNSPNRGDFKSSLNAQPVPYYVTNWNF